jgi:hypothetical protein
MSSLWDVTWARCVARGNRRAFRKDPAGATRRASAAGVARSGDPAVVLPRRSPSFWYSARQTSTQGPQEWEAEARAGEMEADRLPAGVTQQASGLEPSRETCPSLPTQRTIGMDRWRKGPESRRAGRIAANRFMGVITISGAERLLRSHNKGVGPVPVKRWPEAPVPHLGLNLPRDRRREALERARSPLEVGGSTAVEFPPAPDDPVLVMRPPVGL